MGQAASRDTVLTEEDGDMGTLEGKVALVTGAGSGIGRAIAGRLAADGASLVLGDIDDAALERVAAEVGGRVAVGHCDVTVESDQEALVALATDWFGGLDIVVANAGAGAFAPVVDHPLETWQGIIDLCLTGVFLTFKHGGRAVRDGGSLIAISSLNGTQPSAGMAAYCTAKAGVIMLTRVTAMELGARGVRVNAIAPGLVETNATSAFWMVPGVVESFVDNTTLGRFARPDDIADVAAFLASDAASFISGSVLAVDGGAGTKKYPDLPALFARAAAPPA